MDDDNNDTNNYDDYGYDGQDDVDNDQGIGVKTALTMTAKVPQVLIIFIR